MPLTSNPLAKSCFAHRGEVLDEWEYYLAHVRELASFIQAGQPGCQAENSVWSGGSVEFWYECLPAGSEIAANTIGPMAGTLTFPGTMTTHDENILESSRSDSALFEWATLNEYRPVPRQMVNAFRTSTACV